MEVWSIEVTSEATRLWWELGQTTRRNSSGRESAPRVFVKRALRQETVRRIGWDNCIYLTYIFLRTQPWIRRVPANPAQPVKGRHMEPGMNYRRGERFFIWNLDWIDYQNNINSSTCIWKSLSRSSMWVLVQFDVGPAALIVRWASNLYPTTFSSRRKEDLC